MLIPEVRLGESRLHFQVWLVTSENKARQISYSLTWPEFLDELLCSRRLAVLTHTLICHITHITELASGGCHAKRLWVPLFKRNFMEEKNFQQPHKSNDIILEFKEPLGKLSPEYKSIMSPKIYGMIESLLISWPAVFFPCANYFDVIARPSTPRRVR